jgi:hypothetical protein
VGERERERERERQEERKREEGQEHLPILRCSFLFLSSPHEEEERRVR